MTTECSARINALKRGDGVSWAHLLEEFGPQIEGYARRMGAQDAEDVTGSTLESVARTIGTFNGSESQFRSWVFTIAHSRIVDDHRRRSRRPEVEFRQDFDRVAEDRLEALFGGDERVDAALAQLTAEQREMLRSRFVVGLSIREIANVSGRSEQATRVALHRCIKRLRELIEAPAPVDS